MSFRYRVLVVLAVVGVAPLLLLGWTSLLVNRRELLATAGASQARAAEDLAEACQRYVIEGARTLGVSAAYIPFDRLATRDLGAVLEVPLRQLPWLDAVALLDASGDALAPTAWAPPDRGDGSRPPRPPATSANLELLAEHVPLDAAIASGLAIGPPFRSAAGAPRVAVAVRLAGEPVRVLAAQLTLGELASRLRAAAGEGGRAFLVGPDGELVEDAAGRAELTPDEARLVADARGARKVATLGEGEARALAAYAPVKLLGWGVVASRPAAAALGPVERVRRYTLYWAAVALLLTGALGLVLARGVAGPVARLCEAARAVSAGDYAARAEEVGGGELAELARSFNHMTGEVRRRDEEIRAWNAELSQRVEERTAELREAQEQIARSRRLAALGSLSAGVAHALNNPMTSVVGLVSLVRQRLGQGEEAELLDEVLIEARRATRVVQDLRSFSEQEQEGSGQRFPLERPALAALDAFRKRIEEQGIALATEVAKGLPPAQGRAEQIEQLVGHLVENAVAAMPGGGKLGISIGAVDGRALRLCVSDTGTGIAPEIRQRIFDPFFSTRPGSGGGRGLALVHTIVQAHHGSIKVDSEPGQGTRFTVVFPAAAEAPHLV